MNKKLILAVTALVLTGCSSNSTKITSQVTDGSNVVASIESNGIQLTKQDVYESLLSTYGANLVVNKSLQAIADTVITDTERVNSEVDTMISSYKSMLGGEEGLLEYVQSSGYESIDDYKAKVLEPNVKQSLLTEKYVDENFTTLAETYGYSYIQYFTMPTESEAMTVISQISSGETTFDDAATANAGSVPEQVLCYTEASSSTVDSSISRMAAQFTIEGIFSVPVSLSDGTYAVINVVSVDREANRDAIIDSLVTITDVTNESNAYYLNNNNFEVYEEGLVSDIKTINENYIQ